MMNVLFFSVSIGAGHHKAAEALREEIQLTYPQSKTMLVDTLKYINPIIDKLVVSGYLNTLKSTPLLYKKLYEMADTAENMNDFSKVVNNLMSFRIKRLIREFKPDLVVCTHPFPLQMLSELKRKKKITIPVVAVLTDYIIHSFWLQPNVDAFLVAHECMKLDMVRKGIAGETIHPIGIPISSRFTLNEDRHQKQKDMGLKETTTFLIMGGGLGIGEIEDTFDTLLQLTEDIQIVIITGKNMKLRRVLQQKAKDSNKIVKIMSYTSKIHDWMEVADYIFTKPGGMTVSEAISKQKPLIIISPIPGQEEKNANFLVNYGAALRVYEKEDIHLIMQIIKHQPDRILQLIECQKRLYIERSTKKAVEIFRELLIK